MPEINNSNIYSNRTALQIISHMWSLPNTDPPLWESYGLRQCLLGSLQLFDRPEEQLALLEERLSTGDTMNDYKFGREDVLRFMRSISNLQKRNQAYPALSGETSEEYFEITFHHFGLPMPSRADIKKCKDAHTQINPTNLVTKNQAMMAWFAILKKEDRHTGSKETLVRIWTIVNPTRDAAIPFEAFILGLYCLFQKLKEDSFLLPFYFPETHLQILKAHVRTLWKTLAQPQPQPNSFEEGVNVLDPKVPNPTLSTRTIIDSRFLKFGEKLVDQIVDELLQTGLIARGESKNGVKGRKTQQEKNFHMAMRDTMEMLMKWDPEGEKSDIPSSVSVRQVEDFEAGRVPGPRKDNLVIHWEKISCEWNKRAAKVFADYFIDLYRKGTFRSTGDFSEAFIREEKILSAFMSKLHYLSDRRDTLIIKRSGTAETKGILEEESSIIAKRNRRRSRKASLYNVRTKSLLIFSASNDYEAWTQMLNILGVDGTSSDETDEETESTKIHKVRRIPKPWRSNEIDILLRVLDKASREPDPLGRKPKGHQRRRLRTGDHPTLLNPNLISLKYPQNFYDMDWIKEHKPAVIELLTESWGVPLQLPS